MSKTLKMRIIRGILVFFYRSTMSSSNCGVIFQNTDDQSLFVNKKIINLDKSVIFRGSGVDLNKFKVIPEPTGVPVVLLPARLLWDKGVAEFIEAALILKNKMNVRMVLVGSTESLNPKVVSNKQIDIWVKEGVVEYWGFKSDMNNILPQANVICLPSYREGLPKVLQEAAACRRAVVTTDVPGCRDAIKPGLSGILVPVKDGKRLAGAIEFLLENALEREKMAEEGYKLAKEEFSDLKIAQDTINFYDR